MDTLERIERAIIKLEKELCDIIQAPDDQYNPALYLLKVVQLDHYKEAKELYNKTLMGVLDINER